MSETRYAPLCDTATRESPRASWNGSLYCGRKKVLYWRFETIPRQLPPTRNGPAVGARVRVGERLAQRRLEVAPARLAEAAGDQDDRLGLPVRERGDDLERGGRRHGDDREVDLLGQGRDRGHAWNAVDRRLLGVNGPELPVGDALGLLEVLQDDAAGVRAGGGRADDGGALRREELRDLRKGARGERRAPGRESCFPVRCDPPAVRREKQRVHFQLFQRGISERVRGGERKRKILRK